MLPLSAGCHRETAAERIRKRLIGEWFEPTTPLGLLTGQPDFKIQFIPDDTFVMTEGREQVVGHYRLIDSARVAVQGTGLAAMGGEQIYRVSFDSAGELHFSGQGTHVMRRNKLDAPTR